MLEKKEFESNEFWWRLSWAVAVLAGFFSLVVFLLLLLNYLQVEAADPVDNLLLTKMRQEYAALPQQDEALAQRIRDLDLLNRKAFFTSQGQLRTGAWMLLAGVCVFLVAFKSAMRWRRPKPNLEEVPTADQEFLARLESRQLVLWAGVVILALGLGASLLTQNTLVSEARMLAAQAVPVAEASTTDDAAPAAETAAPAGPAFTPPTWDEMLVNWPSFRGPGANGVAHFTTAPTEWDIEAGTNIRWKAEVPMPGPNSPVIWGDRLYVSGADADKRTVYCFNTEDGSLVWSKDVAGLPGEPATVPKVTDDTGFAAPTLVAHGDRVCAIFANGDLVSYDREGNQVWGKNVGLPTNHYGHSSSLLAFDRLLYVQLDQKTDPKLLAFDIATGETVWTAQRKKISWASPVLAQTPWGPQLLLNSELNIDAYEPVGGELIWSLECLDGEVAPSPAYANGMVFTANEYAIANGIQLAEAGGTVEATLAWEYEDYLPEVSSPVGDGERFYFGTSGGTFVCLDAKSGEALWEHDFEAGVFSSPVLVGDRIYVGDNDGNLYIVQAGPEFNLLATHVMGSTVHATPACMDGRIYARTPEGLYCIEQSNG
ncbi:MAG: PQQ-binding-like beta-propeller repeat protein [Candidatus Hydrogenedentes bacterium]|nr:PQQ-binding-like beta-propeller repeat protein [Candidatus Hydrogenedentota bacterium]